MTKQPSDEPQGQTELTHQAEDPRGCQNYLPYDCLKTIDPKGGSQEEDSWVEEDFLEEEDMDSPEEEDIPEEGEYHLEDHLEEDGDHHRSPYNNHNKESW